MRRMLGLVAVATTLAIAAPVTADAATVHSQTGTGPGGVPYYYLYYDGEPGENNDVQIDDVNGTIVFDDVVPVTGVCVQGKPGAPGDTTARTCPTADLTRVIVAAWDGTNTVDARGTAADLLISGSGAQANVLHGGSGDDQIFGDANADDLFGHGGTDELFGGLGNDDLDGGIGVDNLYGQEGGDRLVGGSNGGDLMSGGDGVDTADYSARLGGVIVSIDDLANDGSTGEGDNVKNDIENLVGTDYEDLLTAHAQDGDVSNALLGGLGPDTLVGGNGNDLTLAGGPGDDEIYGEAGNDGLYGGTGEDFLSGAGGERPAPGRAVERQPAWRHRRRRAVRRRGRGQGVLPRIRDARVREPRRPGR